MQAAIDRGDRARPDGGGGGCGDGPADRRAQDRRVRAARPGRPRPDAACQRASWPARCRTDDPMAAIRRDMPLITRMIAEGYTGRKGKGGFYRARTGRAESRVKRGARPDDRRLPRRASKPQLESVDGCARRPARAGRASATAAAATPARVLWARSPTPRRWCRRSPTTSPRSMRRCGSATTGSTGPFELIDRLGAGWLAERLAAEGRPVPPLLAKAAEAGGFYRVAGRRSWSSSAPTAPTARCRGRTACCCWPTSSAPASRWRRTARAALWDIGDGVACLEFHSKMNASIPTAIDADAASPSALVAKRTLQGAGDLQRGREFLASAPISASPCSRPTSRLWPMIEELIEAGPEDLQGAEVSRPSRWSARRRAWRSAAAARSCCIAPRSQAHAESYIGLVEAGVGLVPGWGGCKEMLRALDGRSQARRRARCRRWPRPSRRSAPPRWRNPPPRRSELLLPAPDRRHHHEPRPAAGRRQGAGRWRWPKAISRPAAASCACPALRPRGAAAWRSTASPARQGHARMTSWSRAPGRRADRRRHRPHRAAGRGRAARRWSAQPS